MNVYLSILNAVYTLKCNLRVTWIAYRDSPYPLQQKTENRFNVVVYKRKRENDISIYITREKESNIIISIVHVCMREDKMMLFYIVKIIINLSFVETIWPVHRNELG